MSVRRPLQLYRALLDAVEGAEEDERAAAVRRALRGERSAWPAPLRDLMERSGASLGYVLRGVLSIRGFAPEVREAMERGLPLATARLVNGIVDPVARARALAPLQEVDATGRLLPRGVTARIERVARAERAAALVAVAAGGAPDAGPDGWLAPDPDATPPARLAGDVWIFPRLAGVPRRSEPLHEWVVEGLLARVLPAGGRLVDVTAGTGTIAKVARRHRVASWSGDLAPGAVFVHRADARRLLAGGHPGIGRHVADALVVHPPTFPVWLETAGDQALGGLEAYAEEVGAMITGALAVVRPGGAVVVISRPERRSGRVWLSTSHLAQAMADAELTLEGYVVAVAEGGGEDWHLLFGRLNAAG